MSLPEKLREELKRTVELDMLHHNAASYIESLEKQLAAKDALLRRIARIAAKDANAERWRYITRDGRTHGLRIPATENKASIDAAIDNEIAKCSSPAKN